MTLMTGTMHSCKVQEGILPLVTLSIIPPSTPSHLNCSQS